MSVRGKITKLFAAVIMLAVVATLCVLLVACDPEGKEGGETAAGGGDAIFTEGVTLAELTEKINAAESFVWSYSFKRYDASGVCVDNYSTVYSLDGESVCIRDSETEYGNSYNAANYHYSADGCYYVAFVDEEGETEIEKSLSKYGKLNEYATALFEEFKEYHVSRYLEEIDGQIVFNEKAALVDSDDYVEGSGYVRLKGNILEFGYKTTREINGETVTVENAMTVSLVNAYSFEVTPELKEAEKTAPWAEYVSYNGVYYVKDTDETTGEEYYYVDSADDGAVAETTINTLPVKPRQ